MPNQHPKFRAAAVQHASVLHDLDGGIDKSIAIIDEAAAQGVELLAFPEAWVPGYPYWAWLGTPAWGMQFVQSYHDNSIATDGPELAAIAAAAKRHGMHIVFGFSERDAGTLYLAQSIIGPDGEVIANRRKLKATFVERSVYGEGDGSDLAVHDTALGRLGALCCWEHLQPLSKYALYSMNEQVHVASWPTLSLYEDKAHALGPVANMAASRVYALEGQSFVIAATTVMTAEVQDTMGLNDEQRDLIRLGGGSSCIFAPDGQSIGNTVPPDEEGLVIADIDLGMISLAKTAADPAGHYSRPDVTRLLLNTQRKSAVERFDSATDSVAEPAMQNGPADPSLSGASPAE